MKFAHSIRELTPIEVIEQPRGSQRSRMFTPKEKRKEKQNQTKTKQHD